MKSKRQETSNLLKSLKGFPPFRVSATEYEDGTIEGKVTFMKQDLNNYNSTKYVTHKELKAELDNFVTKVEFNEFRIEISNKLEELKQQFIQNKIETNNKLEELKQQFIQNKIDTNTKLEELKQLIISTRA